MMLLINFMLLGVPIKMKYNSLIYFNDFEIAIFEGIIKDIQNQLDNDIFIIYLGCKLFHYVIFYRCENPFNKRMEECRTINECDYKMISYEEYGNHS